MIQISKEKAVGNTIYIGIGEIGVGYKDDILKITSLGSCIGLVLYPKNISPEKIVAIMSHIMLAQSPYNDTRENRWGPAKYATDAVPIMIRKLKAKGIEKDNIGAKVVGGAQLFGHAKKTLQIGKDNEKMVKRLLSKENIRITKSYTGGDVGMSISYVVKRNLLIARPTGGEPVLL